MEIGAKFKNIISYYLEITKSLEDKLFFVEKFLKNGIISVENTKITCSEDVKTTFEKAVTNISNYDTPTA